jgi:alkylated DNA repair dioxygenase AlkB
MADDHMGVPGLRLVFNAVSQSTADDLLEAVNKQPWSTDLRRRVQHYGYKYNYRERSVHQDDYLGPLPEWSRPALGAVERFFDRTPDQMIVNEYKPGQGIGAHIDCVPCFGPVVASLSLGSGTTIRLRRGVDSIDVYLPKRSLLVLTGDARYHWLHSIAPVETDYVDGSVVARGTRVSLTLRTVKLAD